MHVRAVTKDQGPGICLGFYEHDHWLLYLIGGGKKGEKQNLKNFLPAQFPTNYIYSINGHLFATSSFFLADPSPNIDSYIWGSLSNDDGDANENGKKAIDWDWQNNNSARETRIFVHFFAVVARLQRENA